MFAYSKTNENGIEITDPYDAGIDVLDLNQEHHISQRSIWDGLKFRLEAPSVDWQKRVGSRSIGASFGVVMMNFLDLAIGWLFKLLLNCFKNSIKFDYNIFNVVKF